MASRASTRPGDIVYMCMVPSPSLTRRAMVSSTMAGEGTLGLPMERSKTLSSPICALRSRP